MYEETQAISLLYLKRNISHGPQRNAALSWLQMLNVWLAKCIHEADCTFISVSRKCGGWNIEAAKLATLLLCNKRQKCRRGAAIAARWNEIFNLENEEIVPMAWLRESWNITRREEKRSRRLLLSCPSAESGYSISEMKLKAERRSLATPGRKLKLLENMKNSKRLRRKLHRRKCLEEKKAKRNQAVETEMKKMKAFSVHEEKAIMK